MRQPVNEFGVEPPKPKLEKKLMEEICSKVRKSFSLLFSTKMILLYPAIIFAGLIVNFFAGVFPQLVSNLMTARDPQIHSFVINQTVMICMIFFGIGDSICKID